jgi:hypothetical protein
MRSRWVLLIMMMGYPVDDAFLLTSPVQNLLEELDRKRCKTPSPSSPTATEASQHGTQPAGEADDEDNWMMNLSPATLRKVDADVAEHNNTARDGTQPAGDADDDDNWMMNLSPATLRKVDADVAEHNNTARNVPNDSANAAAPAAADATVTSLLQQFNGADTSMEILSTPARSTACSTEWGLSPIDPELLGLGDHAADVFYAGAQPPTSTSPSGSTSSTRRCLENDLNQPPTPAAEAAPPAAAEGADLTPLHNAPFSPTSPSYTATPPPSPPPSPPPAPAKKQQPAHAKRQQPARERTVPGRFRK